MSRSDPPRDSAALQERMSSLFRSLKRNPEEDTEARDLLSAAGFVPAADIYEDDDSFVVELEIPGMRQDDLDIRLDAGTLTIRGERKPEKIAQDGRFSRVERRFGTFFRTFPLPHTVDMDSVRAKYDAGVLRISLDRRVDGLSKQVRIEAESVSTMPIKLIRGIEVGGVGREFPTHCELGFNGEKAVSKGTSLRG